MKTKINLIITSFLFAILCFTSCQDEITQIENPNEQEAIVPNSTLANLMSRTAANFGAADDILDGSSCFSVELPVTVEVSDITVVIETESDLEQLEDILNNVSADDAVLDFLFPITIIFSDYSQIVIENEDQLQTYIDQCIANENDVIACADFVYPISFSVFNSGFNLVDTVVIANDEALYNFLNEFENEENATIVSLNFPVIIEYANGDTIEVSTNEELADAISNAEQFCENDCDIESIEMALTECQWELDVYSSYPEFQGYLLAFNSDYSFDIITMDNQVISEGNTWSVESNATGLFLVLATDFEDLAGDWMIAECNDDRFQLSKNNQNMVIDQVCEGDLECSIADISGILQECPWDFSNGTGNFVNNQMIFHDYGDLQITEGDTTVAIGGYWNLSATDNGVVLNFSELTAFQESLEGDWLIIECAFDRVVLMKGNQTLIFEQNCNGDLFNCFDNFELVECANQSDFAVFNLTAETIGLIDCPEPFVPSFHETLMDAENNINPIVYTEAYEATDGEIYLRIEAESGDFEIFSIFLNTIECNYFECFESFDAVLEVCDNGTDGPYEFNLPLAFANCTPSADLVTYHETIVDAGNDVNPISNPENYFSINVMQTIYVRVEINNQFEIFPLQLNIIDCNAGNCTVGDIDGILSTCLWNITSYNGSDNLVGYNFSFNQNSGIVVIYNDTLTIDAGWSTSQSDNGVVVEFTNVAGPNIQAINGNWLVVECTASQLVLHNVNNSNNEIVLERTCE